MRDFYSVFAIKNQAQDETNRAEAWNDHSHGSRLEKHQKKKKKRKEKKKEKVNIVITVLIFLPQES